MKLTHEFDLPLGMSDAFDVLSDVERVTSCVPGATVDSRDGDEIAGRVTVKVGPMRFDYRGTARLTTDRGQRTMTLTATGQSTKEPGAVEATIVLHVDGDEAASHIGLETDLALTGRAAQFGGQVLHDVSDSVVRTFVARLSESVAREYQDEPPETPRAAGGMPGRCTPASAAEDSLNVLTLLPRPSAAVLGGVGATLLSAGLAALLLRRRRSAKSPCSPVAPVIVVHLP